MVMVKGVEKFADCLKNKTAADFISPQFLPEQHELQKEQLFKLQPVACYLQLRVAGRKMDGFDRFVSTEEPKFLDDISGKIFPDILWVQLREELFDQLPPGTRVEPFSIQFFCTAIYWLKAGSHGLIGLNLFYLRMHHAVPALEFLYSPKEEIGFADDDPVIDFFDALKPHHLHLSGTIV